jgi:hypothetical protein
MIEKNVVNLELSKKLHELGVKNKSVFYWGIGDYKSPDLVEIAPYQNEELWTYDKMYPSYLASELMEILPSFILSRFAAHELNIKKLGDKFCFHYLYSGVQLGDSCSDYNIANSAAKMLVYLIENKLIEIK